MRHLAKEKGVIRRDRIDQMGELLLRAGRLQESAVVPQRRNVGGPQAFAQTRGNELAFVRAKVDAAALVDEATDEIELAIPHEECPPSNRRAKGEMKTSRQVFATPCASITRLA